jgi:hypothetical protein
MSRHRDGRYDVVTDSLAMVKAAHERDDDALRYLLEAADLRSCAEFLAELGASLIGDLAEAYEAEPVAFIARVRAWQLRSGRGG